MILTLTIALMAAIWESPAIEYKVEGPLKFKRATAEAITQWVIAASGEIDFCKEEISPRLRIRYLRKWPYENINLANTIFTSIDGEIVSALIEINAEHYRWRRKKTAHVCKKTFYNLDAIMLHEIGHALGLITHSTDPTSAMYLFPSVNVLSVEDVKRLMELYGSSL